MSMRLEFSGSQKAEKAIFAVREVVHDLPVYQTRGMASAVDVGGKQCLLTWNGVFNEDDRALTNHKPVKFHRSSECKEKKYQLGKSKIGQAGSFSFIPVEGLKSCNALMLMVPGSNVIENEVCAQSFNGGNKLLKFKFQYIKKEKKHVLTSLEGKGTIEKFAVLGSPIINDKAVIGVVGEDADGQLIPCFITQTELDHKEKNSSESGNSEDLDTEDSAGQHKQASHSTDSAAQPSVLQSYEEKHQEKDPSEAPAPPSHQPISGTSQEECKELREERHKLASEHQENDLSEGGTGNVPYALGGPGETTKDFEKLKHTMTESKYKSKGVPALDTTDALSEAVSDMGLIVSDNDGNGNCLFHALSEQLETVKKIKISHDDLRKTLVQYLKKNRETKDGADLYSMLDRNQRTRFGGWDDYLTDMAKDGIWGDEMIIFAAANHFKTVINVISSPPGKERQEITVRPECKVEDENPIWLGHISDCHFVSLLKAPATPSHQPISGTSQEECKELREERHKLASEHQENDLSEGGTGNVPYALGYDQELADFYASLQPSTTGFGRPQFSMEGVMSQLVDVKMEPDTVQHLELKKDLLRDVEEIERSVIFRGEVTEKGNVWNLPEAAAYVTFHEGAVPKPLLFTCSVWPPKLRSPPISSDELLVSSVIELSHDGPPDLELSGDDEGNVTVALLHSASDLKGYEVVIKQLVDLHDNVWKDLKTWHALEKPEVSDWPQLVEATCTLSRFSSFAVVWRLKSFTFTSGTLVVPQFTCVVPDFPDIRVEVPLGSVPVDQDFTLTIKVQEFPSNEVEDIGILCGPVIHISSSQNIEHMEPVTIKVPLALRESKHDLSELSNEVIRISYLDSEGKQWRDITGQLEGPVTVKDGIVEFKVKHFCCFCPVCLFTKPVALLEDFFHRLSFRSRPQCVHFLTCLCKTPVPDTYSLSLYCYPNFKKHEVEKKLSGYDAPYKGEGKSKEPACVGDGIVVSPIALDFVRESQRNEKIVLRFLGNDISDNSDMALHVRLDSKSAPTVKFSKDQEQQKLLCEVPILKTRPESVGRDQRVVPEERPALATPSDVELERLASELSGDWRKLGRRLKIQESKLENLHRLYRDLSEKGYKMLIHWKEINGSAATYQILGDALQHDLVNRRDLTEKFCFKKQ